MNNKDPKVKTTAKFVEPAWITNGIKFVEPGSIAIYKMWRPNSLKVAHRVHRDYLKARQQQPVSGMIEVPDTPEKKEDEQNNS